MKNIRKLLQILLCISFVLLILPISLWLLFNAQTWVGYSISILGIITAVFPILFFYYGYQNNKSQYLRWVIIFLSVVWFGSLGSILFQIPSGVSVPDAPIRHGFSGDEQFNRYSLTNIIPEIEQINLGFLVMPYFDPILTTEQARNVAARTHEIYQEMEKDDDFRELGSVMGWSYVQLLGMPFDKGHYYLYVPDGRIESSLPALVFLHGSAGNFKAYTWILSNLAEEQGMVIISPSYGFGNWDQASVAAVMRAIDDAREEIEIASDQIYLAGLSNGGLGVSQIAQEYPQMFSGLIFISPVMSNPIIDSDTFQDNWKERPILVISGEEDRRVPIEYVENRVTNLESGNVQVTKKYYSGEDHFMFFAQREDILREISEWLQRVNE